MGDSVVFKGTVNGLTMVLDSEENFNKLLEELEGKVLSSGRFFKDAELHVRYRGRKLSAEEEDQISDMMVKKGGAFILSMEEEVQEPVKEMEPPKLQPGKKLKMSNFFFKGIEEGPAKFYRGTIRSGQLLNFDGNIVVIGDVNPGGEIVATGNVVIMGSLRGIVHAGANGNKEAIIAALNLQPTQLRIADVVTRPPDSKESKGHFLPEIAFIRDERVYIESYLPLR